MAYVREPLMAMPKTRLDWAVTMFVLLAVLTCYAATR
jgi:hypothetical protein